MQRKLFRIGSPLFVNESILTQLSGFDVMFNRNYEFVHVPDYNPFRKVNGTWMGVLRSLLDDMKMG
jgi:hypothetical protein